MGPSGGRSWTIEPVVANNLHFVSVDLFLPKPPIAAMPALSRRLRENHLNVTRTVLVFKVKWTMSGQISTPEQTHPFSRPTAAANAALSPSCPMIRTLVNYHNYPKHPAWYCTSPAPHSRSLRFVSFSTAPLRRSTSFPPSPVAKVKGVALLHVQESGTIAPVAV